MSIQASDLFSLAAAFHPQDSSSTTAKDRVPTLSDVGDVACESMTRERDEFENSFEYCGSDIKTDLGALLTAFGDLANSKIVTRLSLSQQAGQKIRVDVSGVQYPDTVSAIQNFDASALIPASWGGVTVATLAGVTLGAAATPISMSIDISCNHNAEVGADGEVFAAENTNCVVETTVEYIGTPTTYNPPTNYTTDTDSAQDSNSQQNRTVWTGHANVAKN